MSMDMNARQETQKRTEKEVTRYYMRGKELVVESAKASIK